MKVVVVVDNSEKKTFETDLEPLNRNGELIIRKTVSKPDEHSKAVTLAVFNTIGWKYWIYK